jgi:uncharacterized protein YqfB (UPF0267 family)
MGLFVAAIYAINFYMGSVPRVGPLRALNFGFSTMSRPNPYPSSIRIKDINKINASSQGVVLKGKKGIGKSKLVQTVVGRRCGVFDVKIKDASIDEKILMRQILNAVAANRLDFYNPAPGAKRVLFFYRLFFPFSAPPTCILTLADQQYSHLTVGEIVNAARTLREEFGVQVIVDSLPTTMADDLVHHQEIEVITLEPMTKDMINFFFITICYNIIYIYIILFPAGHTCTNIILISSPSSPLVVTNRTI